MKFLKAQDLYGHKDIKGKLGYVDLERMSKIREI